MDDDIMLYMPTEIISNYQNGLAIDGQADVAVA